MPLLLVGNTHCATDKYDRTLFRKWLCEKL